jgi:hypothetical protein
MLKTDYSEKSKTSFRIYQPSRLTLPTVAKTQENQNESASTHRILSILVETLNARMVNPEYLSM